MIKFTFLCGDVNYKIDGTWISNKQSTEEMNYYFVINSSSNENLIPDTKQSKYIMSLSVVSPQNIPEHILQEAFNSYDINIITKKDLDIRQIIEIVYNYGISTPIMSISGTNFKKMMKECKKEAIQCTMLFGFYMDRPVNMIGSTGWDFLKGDITAGIKQYKGKK